VGEVNGVPEVRKESSKAWDGVIERWKDDVESILERWNPRNALRFRESSWLDAVQQQISAPLLGRADFEEYPELADLDAARERLRRLVDQ